MNYRKTKIVATIGSASMEAGVLRSMIKAGMNVARLNFSHGDHDFHSMNYQTIRRVADELKVPVAILQDLSGPKIRTGDFSTETVTLKAGKTFTLTTDKIIGDETRAYVNHHGLARDVEVGGVIRLDDGKIELQVKEVKGGEIVCKIIHGGTIRGRRGVNAPGATLSIAVITDKDKKDLALGAKLGVDFVALSFVQSAQDIRDLRALLEKHRSKARIIAKIETRAAVDNMDEIIAATDGIMVARGDLAVEIPKEEVPLVQKLLIKKCISAGKPVITATQMLESMIESSVPTRAEVNDVANAIFDGTDAVMLSAESAVGKHPILAIETMDSIARTTEASDLYREVVPRPVGNSREVADALATSVAGLAWAVAAKAIIVHTESGLTPRLISRWRPAQPILAITPRVETYRQLALSFGCQSVIAKPQADDFLGALKLAKEESRRIGMLKRGETFVMAAGIPFRKSGTTNLTVVEKA